MTPAEYGRELYEPGDRVATVLIPRDAEHVNRSGIVLGIMYYECII